MADATVTEEDPSIEEILDSIRQIISEDENEEVEDEEQEEPVEDEPLDQSAIDDMDFDAPTIPEPVADEPLDQSAIDDMDFDAPIPEQEQEPEEDIIELTDRVEPEMEIDLIDEELETDITPEPEPEADLVTESTPTPEPEPTPAPIPVDNILTKTAETAAFDAISELARKTAVEHSGITLEDIVRSELKPLLRDWLDKNLPVVIERLVQEELERVSKRVLED